MKKTALLLVMFILSCSIAACGKKKESSDGEQSFAESAKDTSEAAEDTSEAAKESEAIYSAEPAADAEAAKATESTSLAESTATEEAEPETPQTVSHKETANSSETVQKEKTEFIPHDFDTVITVRDQYVPYGFRENRVWVHNASGDFLIDPEGNIIYAVPSATINEEQVEFTEFAPVLNGLTYIAGKKTVGNYSSVSIALDSDGNEIRRFEETGDTTYKIIGASETHFLVLAVKTSASGREFFLISMNADGSVNGEPHVVLQEDDQFDSLLAKYLGENIFAIGTEGWNRTIAFYNAKNNTLQRCRSIEHFSELKKFYDGILYIPEYGGGGYIVTPEDFQEEKRHFVLNYDPALGNSTVQQVGRFNLTGDRLLDRNGNEVDIPSEFKECFMQPDPDGYVLLMNESAFTVLDPDGNPLYAPQAINDRDIQIHAQSGGFLVAYDYNAYSATEENYHGIIDREGVFHAYAGDLSGVRGLDEAQFDGFGCGYLIDYGHELLLDDIQYMAIKSLKTGEVTDAIKETPDSVVYGESEIPAFSADLNNAGVKSTSQSAPEKTSANAESEDVAEMGPFGIIYTDSFEDVLLFDQEGVTVTMENFNSFIVENNNEDNLQALVDMSNLYFDNLVSDRISTDFTGTLYSGDSEELTIVAPSSEWDFWDWVSHLSGNLSELPLQEVTCEFYVRIGKNGEDQLYRRTVRLNDYSEEAYEPLYGSYISEGTGTNGITLEAYQLWSGDAIAYAFKNVSDQWMETDDLIDGNGHIYINGEAYTTITADIADGMTALVRVDSIDRIRKKLEIPNNAPIEMQAVFPHDIVIDLGEVN